MNRLRGTIDTPELGPIRAPQGALAAGAAPSGQAAAVVTASLQQASAALGRLADSAAARAGAQAAMAAPLDPEFRTREDGTVFGEAFDRIAGERIMADQQAGLLAELDQARVEAGEDAGAFDQRAKAALGARLSALRERGMVQVAASLEAAGARLRLPYDRDLARAAAARLQSERQAAAAAQLDTTVDAVLLAARGAGLDATADATVAGALGAAEAALLRMGPQGAFSLGETTYAADASRSGVLNVAEVQSRLVKLREAVTLERARGQVDRLPSLEAKEAWRDALLADIQGGKGQAATLGPDVAVDALAYTSEAITWARSERAADARAVQLDLADVNEVLRAGLPPRASDLAAIRARAQAIGDPDLIEAVTETEQVAAIAPRLASMSLPQLAQWMAGKRALAARDGANPADVRALAFASTVYADGMAQLRTATADYIDGRGAARSARSPAGGASGGDGEGVSLTDAATAAAVGGPGALMVSPGKIGRSALPAVVLGSPAFTRQLAQRVAFVDDYAAAAGAQASGYLTSAEASAVKDVLAAGGAPAIQLAQAIMTGGGARGARILSELDSERGPALAHAAGLARINPEAGAAIGVGLSLEREGAPAAALSSQEAREIAVREVGDAYQGDIRTGAAVRASAEALYRARTAGTARAEILDEDTWRQALREASGAVRLNGRQFGGLTVKDRVRTVAPSWMRAERFADIWRSLTAADWEAMGVPVRSARNPQGLDLGVLRQARPIAAQRDGRYVLQIDGRLWSKTGRGANYVDLGRIRDSLRQRRPGDVR
jgi:hypothetical protein